MHCVHVSNFPWSPLWNISILGHAPASGNFWCRLKLFHVEPTNPCSRPTFPSSSSIPHLYPRRSHQPIETPHNYATKGTCNEKDGKDMKERVSRFLCMYQGHQRGKSLGSRYSWPSIVYQGKKLSPFKHEASLSTYHHLWCWRYKEKSVDESMRDQRMPREGMRVLCCSMSLPF